MHAEIPPSLHAEGHEREGNARYSLYSGVGRSQRWPVEESGRRETWLSTREAFCSFQDSKGGASRGLLVHLA